MNVMRLRVKVRAGARRSRVAGKLGEEWKVEIATPAVEGKANRALIEFLATMWRVPRSAVQIVSGHRSPHKVVEVEAAGGEESLLFQEIENKKT